jgi:alpha-tubulin suppressor-like RCC1 family protein
MAVTGSITTKFVDEQGLDLGRTLIEKDYLISVYPNLLNQLDTPMLMTWGQGTSGKLGDNTTSNRSSPVQTVAFGANWKQVSCGYVSHAAAIKTDGTLWTWGLNISGQLGDNTVTSRSSPVQTVAFGTNWKQVSAGKDYTTAIKTDGTLWCWGLNASGQLGDNTATTRSSPVQTVAFGTNWKQVSAGYKYTAAIKTDGTLWCWGENTNGQLGDNTRTNRSSPVQTVAFGTNWKQVSIGIYSMSAVKLDGTLWGWGWNVFGELGDNTSTARSSPVQTVAFGNNWKQVSCGSGFTTAVKNDNTLWCWGSGFSGMLGDNTTTDKSSPVQTVTFGTNWKQVSCLLYHCAAVKTDGTLWSWGQGTSGQIGDNTTTSRSSPVQTVIFGNTWKSVSAGASFTFAIKDGDF